MEFCGFNGELSGKIEYDSECTESIGICCPVTNTPGVPYIHLVNDELLYQSFQRGDFILKCQLVESDQDLVFSEHMSYFYWDH